MPWEKPVLRDFDEEEIKGKRYITFTDVREYGYANVIAKVMRLKEPHKFHTLRPRPAEGRRFIRNGATGTNTDLEIEITKCEKVMFIKLSEEFCKADLATNNPPVTRCYKTDLYGVLKHFYPKFFPSQLFVLYFEPVAKIRQVNLDGGVMGRRIDI
jgi:hypothetical protein